MLLPGPAPVRVRALIKQLVEPSRLATCHGLIQLSRQVALGRSVHVVVSGPCSLSHLAITL